MILSLQLLHTTVMTINLVLKRFDDRRQAAHPGCFLQGIYESRLPDVHQNAKFCCAAAIEEANVRTGPYSTGTNRITVQRSAVAAPVRFRMHSGAAGVLCVQDTLVFLKF